VLFILKRFKEKTMSDIARFMSVSKPNLTPIIDRLILDGYVERKPGSKDRRKLLISLTDEGLKYLEQVESKIKGYTASKLEGLSLQDLHELNESSKKIIEILKKLET
jgi:DNA-binding MarR family transcriptional regulator